MSRSLLFCENDLRRVLESQEQKLMNDIESYDGDKLLNTSTEDLVEYFTKKYIVEPIQLIEEDIYAEQQETKVDVRYDRNRIIFDKSRPVYITGTAINLNIPFIGDAELFKCQPSSFTFSPPFGVVEGNKLVVTVTSTDHNAESIKQQLNRNLDEIRTYISTLKNDMDPWNNALANKVRNKITYRKDKLLKDRGLVASLGFKMRKNVDDVMTYAAPEVRRKLPPKAPTASISPYMPEPTMDMVEYEHILDIIKMCSRMLERSPQAFKGMDEEHLRDQFLVPLNSHYEGQASGETFNFNGKTDILIRVGDKIIFIAECKIWRGQKAFLEAIDQLLGYATWRDTKVAIIVFNRNKELTNVLVKIEEIIKTHKNYKRDLKRVSETEFRYLFGHRDDLSRELILSVLVFEVPI